MLLSHRLFMAPLSHQKEGKWFSMPCYSFVKRHTSFISSLALAQRHFSQLMLAAFCGDCADTLLIIGWIWNGNMPGSAEPWEFLALALSLAAFPPHGPTLVHTLARRACSKDQVISTWAVRCAPWSVRCASVPAHKQSSPAWRPYQQLAFLRMSTLAWPSHTHTHT